MQIQNNYNSFSGREYQNSHTHHITKCLHEEEHHRKETAAAGIKQDAAAPKTGQEAQQDEVFPHGVSTKRQPFGIKKGLGMMKGFWESMGDETKEGAAGMAVIGKESPESGIEAVSAAIRQGLPWRIVNKWEGIRDKLGVGIKSALKRFGRERDAFGALSDPKGRFTGKKGAEEQRGQKAGKGTRRAEPDILTAAMSDTHLMDSYSKTGEYCRLNENLTYQKSSGEQKAGEAALKRL